jgi:hypothetical protein
MVRFDFDSKARIDHDYSINRRRRGIEARRKWVSPVGAWFSQVGHLHQVHHLWQYP